jgi:hypothetical protein
MGACFVATLSRGRVQRSCGAGSGGGVVRHARAACGCVCLRLGCCHLHMGAQVGRSLQRNVPDADRVLHSDRRCVVLASGEGGVRLRGACAQRRWAACDLMLLGLLACCTVRRGVPWWVACCLLDRFALCSLRGGAGAVASWATLPTAQTRGGVCRHRSVNCWSPGLRARSARHLRPCCALTRRLSRGGKVKDN